MEDVCPVLVKINALHLFRVDVARNVIALVDDKHGFSGGFGLLGEDSTVKARADDEIIVWHNNSPFRFRCVSEKCSVSAEWSSGCE